ncbi:FBD-associated F-box protein At5g22730-like isoform X3 [Hordeum vulgare subsp. vulgare]|uniref:FBD-associated F-box protein At5g22730-like isoform X3 n=1 Tax=Hordeum vulgare subsp. vulgare TaxID=112509 RepID=UPI000295E5B1|nr:FBD-associated F-box protein At5g22730-like isoform X3 [Hordeum vulgare subsp. vulgare]
MAERAKPGKIKKVAVAGGKDCFEDLPEHVLELLLSFLPSRDAVRTSVLARRWRALWKSVPALRFYPFQFESAKAFNNFVYKLLEHRDRTSPLLQCDIIPYQKGKQAEAHRDVESWIFRKDLKWCPVFSKLKTVLLNEWCLTANFTGLLYFLQHTPILEKFTLQLPARKDFDIGSSGSYNPAEYFLVSKHLKVVEIHCSKEDEWICQIVDILGIHGVTSAQISIEHDSWSSFRFSFQQPK